VGAIAALDRLSGARAGGTRRHCDALVGRNTNPASRRCAARCLLRQSAPQHGITNLAKANQMVARVRSQRLHRLFLET